jgi:hypothetical protein
LLGALIAAVIAVKIPLWEPQFLMKRSWHGLWYPLYITQVQHKLAY